LIAKLRARRTLTLSKGGFLVFSRRFSLTLLAVSVKTMVGTAPLSCSAMDSVVSPG
jgi:hypothetical protein